MHNEPNTDRVETARQLYDTSIIKLLEKRQLSYPPENLYLRIFKSERELEVWGSNGETFTLLKTYSFTGFSGKLGPKQREGDLQIPEGFYHIDLFNPKSNYLLSMRVSYPNKADRIRNKNEKEIGGDIFIHGSNKSIGCIPIGDEHIQELYWLCWKHHLSKKGKITVHIFPFRMTQENLDLHKSGHSGFWQQLEPAYSSFESKHKLGSIAVGAAGNYIFTP